jgi:uncharacterized membrane protein YhaH (DUF805 family)
MEVEQGGTSRRAKRTGAALALEEKGEGGVDEAFKRSIASLSFQLATLLFSFRGRVNRAKFWLVALGIVVVDEIILLAVLVGKLAMARNPQDTYAPIGPLASIVLLAFLVFVTWISLAVAVKRFHDRDKTGWWILLVFVPVIGGLWYLIECGFLRGTEGHNTFGPDPLAPY